MPSTAESFWRATVQRTYPLSSVMRRVVLGGPGLRGYASSGSPDEWLRLMVPPQRQPYAELPTRHGQSWVFGLPAPVARWYSVRRFDPGPVEEGAPELVVDVVDHEQGVATRWAREAEPGDQVLISQPQGRWDGVTADWLLLVADQTGIPAACRILAELPAGKPVHAIFEAPDEGATFTPQSPGTLRLCWVYNPAPATMASPLSSVVRAAELPAGSGYLWMAGEAGCSRDIRRYVRHELGWRSTQFDITGYWRHS